MSDEKNIFDLLIKPKLPDIEADLITEFANYWHISKNDTSIIIYPPQKITIDERINFHYRIGIIIDINCRIYENDEFELFLLNKIKRILQKEAILLYWDKLSIHQKEIIKGFEKNG